MRRAISVAQVVYVTALLGLLAAGFPSFAEHEPSRFSAVGFMVGVGIALAGFGVGSLLSGAATAAADRVSNLELWFWRGCLVSFLGAMTAFTAGMYIGFSRLLFVIAGFIVLGVICVAGSQVASLARKVRDV